MSSPVTLEFDNKVAIITLNRPEVLNAINEAMLPPWFDALEECRTNSNVAVILVTGAGEAFCRGGDTTKLGANTVPSPLEIKEQFWERLHRIPKKLAEIDKPVIAAVNGLASGAGVDVSLQCDIRLAARSANFRTKLLTSSALIKIQGRFSISDHSLQLQQRRPGMRLSSL